MCVCVRVCVCVREIHLSEKSFCVYMCTHSVYECVRVGVCVHFRSLNSDNWFQIDFRKRNGWTETSFETWIKSNDFIKNWWNLWSHVPRISNTSEEEIEKSHERRQKISKSVFKIGLVLLNLQFWGSSSEWGITHTVWAF